MLAGLVLLAGAGQAAAQTETTEYYGTDAVGSVRIVFDASGAVLGRQDYDPFGREILSAWGVSPERFGGQSTDGEVQQSYFHARQFQGRTGRFATPDFLVAQNIFTPQSLNRYEYGLNNPESIADYTGLDPAKYHSGVIGCKQTAFEAWAQCKTAEWMSTDPSTFRFTDWFERPSRGGTGSGPGGTRPGTTPTVPGGNDNEAPPTLPPPNPCSPGTANTTVVSGNVTSNAPTTTLGATIGGALGGPLGSLAGGLVGSFFGIGITGSYVPSTGSAYVGGRFVFAPALGGGNGLGANVVMVPPGQNPNSIANGLSLAVTFQPILAAGGTVTRSPGSGPPVVGPSMGTRVPVSYSISYNVPVSNGCKGS